MLYASRRWRKSYTTPTSISEVSPIEEGRNQIIRTRNEIARLVETPLLPACEQFYNKNIMTLSTTANVKNIHPEGFANIVIDFDSLSPENQEIASESGRVVNYDNRRALILEHGVNSTTSVEEIRKWSNSLSEKFKKQPMTWAPQYTKEQLIEWMMADDTQTPDEIAQRWNYYYDEETNTFFLSEEHAIKTKEKFDTQIIEKNDSV